MVATAVGLLASGCSGSGSEHEPELVSSPDPTEQVTAAVDATPEQAAVPTVHSVPAVDSEPTPTAQTSVAESALLAFKDCGQVYLCAELEVPADHDNPDAGTVTLELGMLPAPNQSRRIGVLLVNPGGPGGDMNSFLSYRAGLTSRVLARFDVVGWNPRGVMGSVPHHCRDEAEMLMLLDPNPDTAEEEAALDDAAREVARACLESLGENARLIGTVQTVADMDFIRQALGEEQISYLGYSYGSLLGLLYADQYGANARAIVVAGAIDPALDSEDLAVGQLRGFARVFEDMLDACRQNPECPIPGDPAEAFRELASRVEEDPLLDPQGNVLVGPAEIWLATTFAAYDPNQWEVLHGGIARALVGYGLQLHTMARRHLATVDWGSLISIGCTDDGRMTDAQLERLNRLIGEEAGDLGRSSSSSARPCVYWTDTDPRPVETILAPEASAVLVIGNRGDNATPYEWAVSVAEILETGVLLTYNGQGHLSYRRHPCVNEVVDAYLIDLILPTDDIECG